MATILRRRPPRRAKHWLPPTVLGALSVTGAQNTSAATNDSDVDVLLVVTGAQNTSACTNDSAVAVGIACDAGQNTEACATDGTIGVEVNVDSTKDTEACLTEGSIGAEPALQVEGDQNTEACVTAGTIDTRQQSGSSAGASPVSLARLRKAEQNRRKFEEERDARLAGLERPPLQPAPETVVQFKALQAPPIEIHDDEEEEMLLLLLAS